jgi:hypothetical protein
MQRQPSPHGRTFHTHITEWTHMQNTLHTVTVNGCPVRWNDTLLFAELHAQRDSDAFDLEADGWSSLPTDRKATTAVLLLTPRFLLEDVIAAVPLVSFEEAARLIRVHCTEELRLAVIQERTINNGTLETVPVLVGSACVLAFLMFILGKVSTSGNAMSRCLDFVRALDPLRRERFKLVPQAIERMERMVALHVVSKALDAGRSSGLNIPTRDALR